MGYGKLRCRPNPKYSKRLLMERQDWRPMADPESDRWTSFEEAYNDWERGAHLQSLESDHVRGPIIHELLEHPDRLRERLASLSKPLKPRRGRPKSTSIFSKRDTGIAFLDLTRNVQPGLLGYMLTYAPEPCERCNYHSLIHLAQELLGEIHANNLHVFSKHRGGRRRGKRNLISALLSPWKNQAQYPFNLTLDDPKRTTWLPSGLISPMDLPIVVDTELADLDVDAVDVELVGLPQTEHDPPRIEYTIDNLRGRSITPYSTVYQWDPLSDDQWETFLETEEQNQGDGVPLIRSDGPIWEKKDLRNIRTMEFARFVEMRKENLGIEGLRSRNVLDRAVGLYVIKQAQGAGDSKQIKRARDLLLAIFDSEFKERSGWLLRRHPDLDREQAYYAARVIGGRLLWGDDVIDLNDHLKKVGDSQIYEFLQTRRIDALLRYHIEFAVYLWTWNFIETAKAHHHTHCLDESDDGSSDTTLSRHAQVLISLFDPYVWVYGHPSVPNLVDDTPIKRIQDLVRGAEEQSNLEKLLKALEQLKDSHWLEFSQDAYDPQSGKDAVHHIRGYLPNKLKTWASGITERTKPLLQVTEDLLILYHGETGAKYAEQDIIRMRHIDGMDFGAIVEQSGSSRPQIDGILGLFETWLRKNAPRTEKFETYSETDGFFEDNGDSDESDEYSELWDEIPDCN